MIANAKERVWDDNDNHDDGDDDYNIEFTTPRKCIGTKPT